jgi:anti-sigma factor RsiW
MNHINEGQWNAWLAEEEKDSQVGSHLTSCEMCRAEGERLRAMFAEFSGAARLQAERDEAFWTRQRAEVYEKINKAQSSSWMSRWQWAVPVPIAVMSIVIALVLITSPTQKPLPAQSSDASDEALLLQVQYDAYRQVPSALEPAGLLLQERNRVMTSKKAKTK